MTSLYHGAQFQPDLAASIGNTPLIRLRRASEATGCTILGKAEFMNPGGSVKDRAGLAIITDAEQRGTLKPGGTVVEGTAGNTGIGLTLVGNARGYRCVIVMPETQSQEKIDFLRMIGADLRLVPAKPYRDPGNYVHVSRRMAEEMAAPERHDLGQPVRQSRQSRGPSRPPPAREIWEQTGGKVDAFTCACGTGGTLAGVALALKGRNPQHAHRAGRSRGQRPVWLGQEQRPDDAAAARSPRASASRGYRRIWTARRSTTPNASPIPKRWSRSSTY